MDYSFIRSSNLQINMSLQYFKKFYTSKRFKLNIGWAEYGRTEEKLDYKV